MAMRTILKRIRDKLGRRVSSKAPNQTILDSVNEELRLH